MGNIPTQGNPTNIT